MSLTKVSYSLITGAPINVKDYGAVGDGATNDAAAIQLAITAAAGGTLYFPAGTYLVGTQLTGVSNIHIIGAGSDVTTLKASAAINSIILFSDKSNVEIEGLKFDGNSNTLSNIRAYATNYPTQFSIHHCYFTGTKNDVTLSNGCIEFSQTGGRYQNVSVCDNTFKTCGTHGAIMAYVDRLVFSRNILKDIGQHGMEAVGCFSVIESENLVDNCGTVGPGGSGLGVGARTTYWKIANNTIVNCAGDAPITCEFTSNYGIIEGNVIKISRGNAGINASYGAIGDGNPYPYDTLRNVSIVNNYIENAVSGVLQNGLSYTTAIGINIYAGTQGSGCEVCGNTLFGFNIAIQASYFKGMRICDNFASGFVGTLSSFIVTNWISTSLIDGNVTDDTTLDHTIQLLKYTTNSPDANHVSNNVTYVSGTGGTKSVVYIDGTGSHTVYGNKTQTAKYYLETAAASIVSIIGNYGPVVTATWSCPTATVLQSSGNYNGLLDFSVIKGMRIFGGTAPPVSGTFALGDQFINSSPAVGSPKGWTCTVAGTPGTFVSQGNL
jgi:hypothetical protein